MGILNIQEMAPTNWALNTKKNKQKKNRNAAETAETSTRPQILLWHIHINVLLANICITYRSTTTQNLSNLEFNLSMSLKVKQMMPLDSPYIGSHKYLIRRTLLDSFARYKPSKSEIPGFWPFKFIQGQIWWCQLGSFNVYDFRVWGLEI